MESGFRSFLGFHAKIGISGKNMDFRVDAHAEIPKKPECIVKIDYFQQRKVNKKEVC